MGGEQHVAHHNGRPTKVVFIAGLGRSGSTLLGAMLGQLDGFFYVGELAQTGRWLGADGPCGCGKLIADCPTWRAIFAEAFRDRGGEPDPEALGIGGEARGSGVVRQVLRTRRLAPPSRKLERSRAAFDAVFRAIPQVTGDRIVVDSSKWPGYGVFLDQTEAVELYVVHLVRDPRAVAHSRLRTSERRPEPLRPGPRGFAVVWDLWNPIIELCWRRGRYLRVRYEDVVSNPRTVVARIAALVGQPSDGLRLLPPDRVELSPTHSVAGNRCRFETGAVRLRPDDEWLTSNRLSRGDRRFVGVVTRPLRGRYGYAR